MSYARNVTPLALAEYPEATKINLFSLLFVYVTFYAQHDLSHIMRQVTEGGKKVATQVL